MRQGLRRRRRAVARAGLEYRPLYTLRHTYTLLMLSAGKPLQWVADQLRQLGLRKSTRSTAAGSIVRSCRTSGSISMLFSRRSERYHPARSPKRQPILCESAKGILVKVSSCKKFAEDASILICAGRAFSVVQQSSRSPHLQGRPRDSGSSYCRLLFWRSRAD
jgi:hypothetical protein